MTFYRIGSGGVIGFIFGPRRGNSEKHCYDNFILVEKFFKCFSATSLVVAAIEILVKR